MGKRGALPRRHRQWGISIPTVPAVRRLTNYQLRCHGPYLPNPV